MSKPRFARRFDRVRVGDGHDYVCVAFDPPWWGLHRWIVWFWQTHVRKREHGVVHFAIQLGGGKVLERSVRVMRALPPPRFNVEDMFRVVPA